MSLLEIEFNFGKSYADKLIIWIFKVCFYYTIRFIRTFFKNYSNLSKALTRNASNFKLFKFTVIYIVIAVCIGFGIGPILFLHDPDVLMYVGLITLAVFIPYFIFIFIFFIYYLLQRIYLVIKSLWLTIKSIRKLK